MNTVMIIALLLLLLYMCKEAHRNKVEKTVLSFDNFPVSFGEITIFFISDIHRRKVSEKIVNEVKGNADIVIIGGDLTERGVPFKRVVENVRRLRGIGPVYFVWGNNDYKVDYHELDALLLHEGVKILDNTAVTFESSEGEKFTLMGIDDISKKRDRLDLAISDARDGDFRVLVCHNPAIVNKIKRNDRVSLVLSGHTHGGQIRFFNFGLYEKGGVRKINNTTILVSNGYGTTGIPLRLGSRAETHLITIRSTK